MRRFQSMTRLRTIKSRVFQPICALQGKRRGIVQIPWRYSSKLLQGQGVYPNIISQSISPRLQISDRAVQGSFLRSWGAMQMGVPHISVSFFLPKMSALHAKPKSATLCMPPFTSTLAGLISLCMYPSFTITSKPFMIWSKIQTHSGSVIFLLASSFLRSESQSSRTMQVQRWPMRCASIWTLQGDLTREVICISPSREAIRVGSRLNSYMFICLIAQNCLSLRLSTLNTLPQLPSPRNTLFLQSYCPPKGNSSSLNISSDPFLNITNPHLQPLTHQLLNAIPYHSQSLPFTAKSQQKEFKCSEYLLLKQFYCLDMNLNIFDSTKHWFYTDEDEQAQAQFSRLQQQARELLPKGFFDRNALSFLRGMKNTRLYGALQSLPKGVLHNVFFDTIQDKQFYRKHIINHPNVYVTQDFISFRIGTLEEAQRYGWISMSDARNLFKTEERFVEALFGITNFTEEEINSVLKDKKKVWSLFERKITNTGTLIYAQDIFQNYVKHILQKFIKNGYQRVEFRAELVRLSQYDSKGKLISKLHQSAFAETFDAAFADIEASFPHFSVGFVFGIRKSLTQEAIQADITKLCELNWPKAVGIDFFQEQDLYGSLQKYDDILERVMSRYPSTRFWKCYHAGETKNHMSRNIEEAVMAGSVRIGHGLNILQRSEFLPFCKHVCFEKCPVSNLLLGYTGDPRESSAPILLGLGYAVSINMGDSGKFGAEDSTVDFFVSSVSYDWTLKHLKLVVLHSLNHCLTKERQRRQMLRQFKEKWNEWVANFLQPTSTSSLNAEGRHLKRCLDIFTSTNNWQFSSQDQKAQQIFEELRCKDIADLPQGFFGKYALTHLYHIRSSELYDVLKDMPKGVLHHLHFDCTEDEQFYREHIITDPNIYLDSQKKHFKIGTKEQAEKEGWISFTQLAEEFPDKRKLIHFVANITMLQKEELQVISGVQHDFWVLFQDKISNFFVLIFTLHIFKKYVRHVLLKYIKNGYQRVEFRALLVKLLEYDSTGAFVQEHDEGTFMTAFDEVYNQVRQHHPTFTAGFIFFGLKFDTEQGNFKRLDKACSYQWPRMIGIDFVQQEDPYGSMEPYIRVGDRIVKKWAHLNLKKVYHAGETKDHTNNNVEQSVRSGSVRIGHGLNIVKRIEYLNQCRHICFQLNPISNLLTGGMTDLRMSPAPLLLGLGYSVSISPDDPGKFGYEDTTVDFFASAVSFNWTLRHFKLVAYHSINHAIVTQGERIQLLECFNRSWNEWVERLVDRDRYAKRPPPYRERVDSPIQGNKVKRESIKIVTSSNPVILSRINST